MEIKDSGTRETFSTGAVRDAKVGKGRFDLLPFLALRGVCLVLEVGGIKYEPRNWEKGMPVWRCIDSAFRHLLKFVFGMRDEPHLYQAIVNLLFAAEIIERVAVGMLPDSLLVDMPKPLSEDVQARVCALIEGISVTMRAVDTNALLSPVTA